MKKQYLILLALLGPFIIQAQMTYYVGESVMNSSKKDKIIEAMDFCVDKYNDYSNYTTHVYVYYSSGIPTAHASYSGGIGFGGSISGKTAMHEMSHVLGVGTYWNWDGKVGTKWLVDTVYIDDTNYSLDSTKIIWAGDSARAQLHAFNGPDATLGCDKSHFWPYGLNYSAEDYHHHVWMVGALRYDMGLGNTSGQGTGYRSISLDVTQKPDLGQYGAAQLSWQCDSAIIGGVIVERSNNGGTFSEVFRTTDDAVSSYVDSAIVYGKYSYRVKRIVPWTKAYQYSHKHSATFQREGDRIVSYTKPATTSSSRDSYTADKVTDVGKTNASRWLTAAGASLPQWVEIDLIDTYDISYIKFYTGYDGYNQPITDFKFQVWKDGGWTDALDVVGNSSSKYEGGFAPVETNKVRLYITKTKDGIVRLYELEVFGHLTETSALNITKSLPALETYPNPAHNNINISGLDKKEFIQVYNLSGKQVYQCYSNKQVDISHLEKGVYLIKVAAYSPTSFIKH